MPLLKLLVATDSSGYGEVAKSVPEIIREASTSTLGILALMIFVLGILAVVFFREASAWIRIGVFVLLLGCVVLFGKAVLDAASTPKTVDGGSSPSPSPPSIQSPKLTPKQQLYSDHTTVYSTKDWLENPQISIPGEYGTRPLKKVRITATGTWTGDANSRRYVGPGGGANPAGPGFAAVGVNEWCLLVKVQSTGRSDLLYFHKDDDHLDISAPSQLLFRINDSPKLWDNAGSLEVSINEVSE